MTMEQWIKDVKAIKDPENIPELRLYKTWIFRVLMGHECGRYRRGMALEIMDIEGIPYKMAKRIVNDILDT
jgi:hypothetical protein